MTVAVKAWQLRQAARESLDRGDSARALALASEALDTHRTRDGELLRLLGAWLNADSLKRAHSDAGDPR
jgi:hypothetical protein